MGTLCLFLWAPLYAQEGILNQKVQLELVQGTVLSLLKHLEEKSGVTLSYSNRLCLDNQVTLSRKTGSMQFFLNELFLDCPVDYLERGGKLIIHPRNANSQAFTIKGYVVDGGSGERLIGANVYDIQSLNGSSTNSFGFFSLLASTNRVNLRCSYVGYQSHEVEVVLRGDTTLYIKLKSSIDLEGVDVLSNVNPEKMLKTAIGVVDFPVEQIRNVPSLMGEVDVIKAIQMAPGVQSGNEGMGGIYVRGGGADENMVLLDDVPLYNISHLLGFFSVFNADAIHKVSMIKSGFPSRYGGRLSSVFDIRMKEGNLEEYHGSASLGLISSNLSAEGPIVKHKSSFMVSARRTYFDLISTPLQLNRDEKFKYYFYDINAKLNYIFSPSNRIYLSIFTGKDDYDTYFDYKTFTIPTSDGTGQRDIVLNDENGSGWGNWFVSSRWNHVFGEKLFSNTTVSVSDFRFYVDQKQNQYDEGILQVFWQRYFSGIRDASLKLDFDYYPTSNHHVRFGANVIYHVFYPGVDLFTQKGGIAGESSDTLLGNSKFYRPEYHAYLEDDFSIGRNVRLNAGLHLSALFTGSNYYANLEPRITAAVLLNHRMSVKASYTKMSQYVHLVRSGSLLLPSDMWLPVTDVIAPLISHQVGAGWEYEISKGSTLSAEVYYKKQKNILTYTAASGFWDLSGDWIDRLTVGEGETYGLELFYQKKVGRMSGWVGYTLSKAENQFPEINGGKRFAANFDRRHDISLFGLFEINERLNFSASWVFGTGHPVTLPTEWYWEPNFPTEPGGNSGDGHAWVGDRNNFKMPNFHRLDVGLTFTKNRSWGSSVWSFGLNNAYSRQNPFFLYFSSPNPESENQEQRVLKQYSLFPFPLPYVRYTIKF